MSLLDHNTKSANGVYYLTEEKDSFSSCYIKVRDIEKRVYSDEIVAQLPFVNKNHHYYKEWKLRQKSTKRIVNYLSKKKMPLKILDLGCGNGWFSNQLSKIPNSEIYAVDINHIELEQAARVFQVSNLKFIYADIFSTEAEVLNNFDIVTVNSCFQYFNNAENITTTLKNKLKLGGELHILDSPFYASNEVSNAKKRTKNYYQKLGVPEMADHYFHHEIEALDNFEIMYQPKTSIINKLLKGKDSPFMWLKLLK